MSILFCKEALKSLGRSGSDVLEWWTISEAEHALRFCQDKNRSVCFWILCIVCDVLTVRASGMVVMVNRSRFFYIDRTFRAAAALKLKRDVAHAELILKQPLNALANRRRL